MYETLEKYSLSSCLDVSEPCRNLSIGNIHFIGHFLLIVPGKKQLKEGLAVAPVPEGYNPSGRKADQQEHPVSVTLHLQSESREATGSGMKL